MSLVAMESHSQELFAIIVDTPDTNRNLSIGNTCSAIFKETEVSIFKAVDLETQLNISLRNQIPGTIKMIKRGELLSRVEMLTPIGLIASIITSGSLERLSLQVGDTVYALIKTNEIMLSF